MSASSGLRSSQTLAASRELGQTVRSGTGGVGRVSTVGRVGTIQPESRVGGIRSIDDASEVSTVSTIAICTIGSIGNVVVRDGGVREYSRAIRGGLMGSSAVRSSTRRATRGRLGRRG